MNIAPDRRQSTSTRVLIVEDDADLRRMMLSILADEYVVEGVGDAESAIVRASEARFDVLVTDVKLPRLSGIDLIPRITQLQPKMAIIVVSGEATVDMAVTAMKRGALDFLTKPFTPAGLRGLLRVAATRRPEFARQAGILQPAPEFIAESEVMRAIVEQVDTIAPFTTSVLITGETGTGKELVARRLHALSSRANRPFIALNCAAVPEQLLEDELFGHVRGAFTGAEDSRVGRFEQAEGGTLLLDEIGDMSLGLQAKLLRVLEEREFEKLGSGRSVKIDIRVVAATSANLEARIELGTFRPDLYYRLNVMRLDLPPLRTHPTDIAPLAEALLTRFCHEAGLPSKRILPETLAALLAYPWPGNARQLRNAMERAAAMTGASGVIGPDDLPDDLRRAATPAAASTGSSRPAPVRDEKPHTEHIQLDSVLKDFERRLLLEALDRAGGNKVQAARLLGIKRTTFMARLRRVQADAD